MQLVIDTALRTGTLALVAMGLSAVFSISRFANIAHVEFATFGALVALLATEWFGVDPIVAGVVAVVLTGLFALLLERAVFRRLLQSGAATAMVGSLALEIFLRAGHQTAFGVRPRAFERPLERAIEVAGGRITPTQMWVIGVSVVVAAAFLLIWHRTKLGRTVRAVSANPSLAEASGINIRRSVDAVWFMSAGVAAVGGTLIAVTTQVSVNIGFNLLLPVFAAAILGGIGSPGGAVIGAAIIALAENLVLNVDFGALVGGAPTYVPISYGAAVGFAVLVVTLLTRPQGIFGGGARDA